MRYEIRQLECYLYDDEWSQNTSYNLGTMETKAKNEKRAITRYLANKHGITVKRNRTRIEFEGHCYTIIDRKTREPLFIAIPNYYK